MGGAAPKPVRARLDVFRLSVEFAGPDALQLYTSSSAAESALWRTEPDLRRLRREHRIKARMRNPRASAPKIVPRIIANLWFPALFFDAPEDGLVVPLSAAAPRIDEVPTRSDTLELLEDDEDKEEVDEESVLDCDEEALVELSVDDGSVEELLDAVSSAVCAELGLDVSSLVDAAEVLAAVDSVVGDEVAVASETAEAMIDVTWV